MFPNFPNLVEAIASERAADSRRDAALRWRASHVTHAATTRSRVPRHYRQQADRACAGAVRQAAGPAPRAI